MWYLKWVTYSTRYQSISGVSPVAWYKFYYIFSVSKYKTCLFDLIKLIILVIRLVKIKWNHQNILSTHLYSHSPSFSYLLLRIINKDNVVKSREKLWRDVIFRNKLTYSNMSYIFTWKQSITFYLKYCWLLQMSRNRFNIKLFH